VVEPLRGREPARGAGLLVEVGEDRVHAAELDAQHGLHLGGAEAGGAGVDPGGERQEHVARLGAADEPPHVEEPGEGLVEAVVGHVAVGERAVLHGRDVGFGEAGEVARAETGGGVVGLAFGEFGDHVGRLVPAGRVAEDGPRLGPGAEEVALHVGAEGEVGRVPAAGGGRAAGGEPVVGAEVVEQPVDVDEAQVAEGAVLVVEPAPGGEGDLAEFERVGHDAEIGPRRSQRRVRDAALGDRCGGGDGRDARGLEQAAATDGRHGHARSSCERGGPARVMGPGAGPQIRW
jgi:hypothetical protein